MTRPAEPAGDVAALALELVQKISAISTVLEPQAMREDHDGRGRTGAPDFAGPRAMLENAGRFVAPVLPGDARLRPLKGTLLRLLRIVTRDQTVFNSALLEALRGTLEKTGESLTGLQHAVSEARREAVTKEEEIARRTAELEGLLDSLSGAVHGAVAREAKAREDIGQELLASQKRVDALERDRDVRAENLAAERTRFLSGFDETQEALRTMRLEWSAIRRDLRDRAPSASREAAALSSPASPEAVPDPSDPLRAGLYADFETRFRGSEESIRARQTKDVALFSGAPGPVADLGCGRGEFLEEVKAAGLVPIGCDANPVMVARAREKGLDVDQDDLFRWLSARPDGALGGVTAYQVVEHLPPSKLFDLVELALAKLAPGGRVLFETINPESVYAMKWFWMDLTHVRPVPAPSLAHLLTASGFRDVTIDYRSPVPETESISTAAVQDPSLAAIARLLFAPQDYAVTGVK